MRVQRIIVVGLYLGDANLAAVNPGGGLIDPFLTDGTNVRRALDAIAARSGRPMRVTSLNADNLSGLTVDVQEPLHRIYVDQYVVAPDGTLTGPTPVQLHSMDGGPITAALVDARSFDPQSDSIRKSLARRKGSYREIGAAGHTSLSMGDRRYRQRRPALHIPAVGARASFREIDDRLNIVRMQSQSATSFLEGTAAPIPIRLTRFRPTSRIGIAALGAAAIATGVMDLVYRAFDLAEQPIQAWADNVPGNHPFACVVGLALIVGGAAIFDERSRRFGATVLAGVYAIFAIFWLPRLVTAPAVLGMFPGVYIGILAGMATQVIVICAACIVYETRLKGNPVPCSVRWIFGICIILFGLQHLVNMHSPNNIAMVPAWMPFGQLFWVLFTGSAFLLAGIAVIIRIVDVLAARLLAAMLLVFSAVTLMPILAAAPRVKRAGARISTTSSPRRRRGFSPIGSLRRSANYRPRRHKRVRRLTDCNALRRAFRSWDRRIARRVF